MSQINMQMSSQLQLKSKTFETRQNLKQLREVVELAASADGPVPHPLVPGQLIAAGNLIYVLYLNRSISRSLGRLQSTIL